jgi:RNA polymerase sigma factor for flagellar operon FliA
MKRRVCADMTHTDLVKRHLPLVRTIARSVARTLTVRVDVDDLEGHGMEGLLGAARRYDRGRGASFATFAGYRIRGAMVDAVRSLGPFTRQDVAAHRATGADKVPTCPSLRDLAEAVASEDDGAEELALARERRARVQAAVASLPPRERRLIGKVYFEDKMLAHAGSELGLSRSWSSRLHARAVDRLRTLLAE